MKLDSLLEKYPDLLDSLNYGFECSDGWYYLIDNMLGQIIWHLKYKENIEPVKFVQIKKKFGGLRAYFDGGDDYIRGVVDLAESLSFSICDICGNAGECQSLPNHNWIATRCSQHKYYYRDRDIDNKKKGAVSLDFDGVINSYTSPFTTVDDIPDLPNKGAFEAIKKYLDFGFQVYIFSTRNEFEKGRKAIRNWFVKHNLEQDYVDKLQIVSGKPRAKVYLDDRAWHFSGKFPSVDEIKYFKPWHGGHSSSQK